MLRHIPNILTLLRMVLVVPFVYFMAVEDYWLAFITLMIAGASDFLDGWLARTMAWQSQFGSIADPVADKLLLVSVYLALGMGGQMAWTLVVLVVVRDIYILLGSFCYWFLVGKYRGDPTLISKVCTFCMIMLALGKVMVLVWPVIPEWVFVGLAGLVVALCLFSMAQYTVLGVSGYLKKRHSQGHRYD